MVVFAMARFIYVCEDQIKAIRGEEGEKKYRTNMFLYYVETSVKEIVRFEIWMIVKNEICGFESCSQGTNYMPTAQDGQ